MTSVSAGHIILTPTPRVGSGRPQRESNPGPPHQESRALLTELPHPPGVDRERQRQTEIGTCRRRQREKETESDGDKDSETAKEKQIETERQRQTNR